jgi:hypothetical protein
MVLPEYQYLDSYKLAKISATFSCRVYFILGECRILLPSNISPKATQKGRKLPDHVSRSTYACWWFHLVFYEILETVLKEELGKFFVKYWKILFRLILDSKQKRVT